MKVPPRSVGTAQVRARRSFFARRVILPTQRFLHTEGVGAAVLLVAALAALAAANSPWRPGLERLLEAPVAVQVGPFGLREDLRHAINDGLMTLFFFVAGLEIKRELVEGDLSEPRRAALPVAAALGGMAAPALIYLATNLGAPGARGWGIPMATDIAFAVGALSLLGDRVPASVRVFLLALAIVDDLGAILIIAVFYSDGVSFRALGDAAGVVALIAGLRWAGVRGAGWYVAAGVALWLALHASGIHATIAGVILGAMTPTAPAFSLFNYAKAARRLQRRFRRAFEAGDLERAEALMGQIEELSRGTEPPLERRLRQFHPWSSLLVLPLFALANAGVALAGPEAAGAPASRVTWGVLLGLVVGKPLGVAGLSWLAIRLGLAAPPSGASTRHLVGAGLLAGIGFTVSLFITDLAFDDPARTAQAKVGILAASLVAGAAGCGVLLWGGRNGKCEDSPQRHGDHEDKHKKSNL